MENINLLYRRLYRTFSTAKKILITSHENPDGDAIGSLLALSHYFDQHSQENVCFLEGEMPSQFYFLPGIKRIKNNLETLDLHLFDLLIFVDCGDLKRSPVARLLLVQKPERMQIINIDHHTTNTVFEGRDLVDLHLIDRRVSSTAEIIFNFFEYHRESLNKEIATCLLTGILTDTSSFSNMGTTISSLSAAGKLLLNGVNLKKIVQHTLKNKSIALLRLWGKALSRLIKDEKTGLVTTMISQEDFNECGLNSEATEGISNFLNNLTGARAVLVLKELGDGKIKGSFRSTDPEVDVSKMAQVWGGGGHRNAAGFTTTGKIIKTSSGWQVKKSI